MQAPLQEVRPLLQPQAPAEQVVPPAQALPHPPQFAGSVWSLMQEPLQRI